MERLFLILSGYVWVLFQGLYASYPDCLGSGFRVVAAYLSTVVAVRMWASNLLK
jgi:hypothetical protein